MPAIKCERIAIKQAALTTDAEALIIDSEPLATSPRALTTLYPHPQHPLGGSREGTPPPSRPPSEALSTLPPHPRDGTPPVSRGVPPHPLDPRPPPSTGCPPTVARPPPPVSRVAFWRSLEGAPHPREGTPPPSRSTPRLSPSTTRGCKSHGGTLSRSVSGSRSRSHDQHSETP